MAPAENDMKTHSIEESLTKKEGLPVTVPRFYYKRTWKNQVLDLKRELKAYARAAKAGRRATPPLKFCVFSRERSGSTLLMDLVNAHPDVQCEADARSTELLRGRMLWPRRYIEACASSCPAPAYGFKLLLKHFHRHAISDPNAFLNSMHQGRWQMIYLARRNLFRQALSQIIAAQTNVWHHMRAQKSTALAQQKKEIPPKIVRVDIGLFMEILEETAIHARCADDIMSNIPHFRMEYERDLLSHEQQNQSMARLHSYLGLPPHTGSTPARVERISQNDWRARLENPDEVETAVRGTPYEKFLNAP